MKQYKTEKESEYYVITPSKAHGQTVKGEKIHFASINSIETFATFEEYEKKCNELNIILEYDYNN